MLTFALLTVATLIVVPALERRNAARDRAARAVALVRLYNQGYTLISK